MAAIPVCADSILYTAANLVAQRICDSLVNDGREPKLSVTIGVAIYPKDGVISMGRRNTKLEPAWH
jgi:hypothetical protein